MSINFHSFFSITLDPSLYSIHSSALIIFRALFSLSPSLKKKSIPVVDEKSYDPSEEVSHQGEGEGEMTRDKKNSSNKQ